MSNIMKRNGNLLANLQAADAAQVVGRYAGRELVQQGGVFIAKEAAKKAGRQVGKQIVKGAGNPMFIVGDLAELGVEAMTDSKVAAKGTSLGIYVCAGAAVGGPAGAAVAAGCWGFGQCVGVLIDKAF